MSKLSGLLFIPLMVAVGLGACSSDDPKTTTDGKIADKDGGVTPKDGTTPTGDKGPVTPPPAELDCTGDKCTDFVFDSLKLPASTEDAKKYGVDFDGNGLWNHDGSSWSRLTTWNPGNALSGWASNLAVDFVGHGVWDYNGSSWCQLTTWTAEALSAADLN